MESAPTLEINIGSRTDELLLVHRSCAERLRWLGVSPVHTEVFTDLFDWHAIADLVARSCPPALALKIAPGATRDEEAWLSGPGDADGG